MISIVIPVCNALGYTLECVSSIRDCTKNYEIILVDNGSNPSIDKHFFGTDIRHVRNGTNCGFPLAVNQGFEVATGEYLCVLNNDTIVTPGWADHLIWHLEDGLDIVGPRTNYIDGPQILLIDRYDNKQELYQQATEHYKKNRHKQWPFHRLVGFCLVVKREVYKVIGGMDTSYGLGNFEDDNFCLQAIKVGFHIGIARDCYVHHFGSITHKLLDFDYVKLIKDNKKIFDSQWDEKTIKELSKLNEERVNGNKRKKNTD